DFIIMFLPIKELTSNCGVRGEPSARPSKESNLNSEIRGNSKTESLLSLKSFIIMLFLLYSRLTVFEHLHLQKNCFVSVHSIEYLPGCMQAQITFVDNH